MVAGGFMFSCRVMMLAKNDGLLPAHVSSCRVAVSSELPT